MNIVGVVCVAFELKREVEIFQNSVEFAQPISQQVYGQWECKMKKMDTVLGFMEISVPQVTVGYVQGDNQWSLVGMEKIIMLPYKILWEQKEERLVHQVSEGFQDES